jgi:hypothetical protein
VLDQHEQPVQAHAKGKPVAARQPGGGQHPGMGEAAFPDLHPAAVVAHVNLAAIERVRMRPRLLAVGQARSEHATQDRDHLVHVGVAHRPPGDPPQVELVRGPGVLPVDGVPAVHDPGADQQHIVARLAGEPTQRRGDHGGGMTAQHVPGVHIPGVAGIPGDRLGWVSEPVVVISDRHDPRAAAPANLAVPGTSEPRHGLADEDLDGVRTFGRIGQIPQAKVALQLHVIDVGNRTGHGDSSVKRTGWGKYLPAWGSPERGRKPNAAQRLPAAHPGPGGEKIAVSACQSQTPG